jgi:flagellar biosynthesis/type III secretory pathway chaperone
MIEDLIDIIDSLTLIMAEETARLESKGRLGETQAMVEAKLRLVAALEVRSAQVARQGEEWLAAVDPALREALTTALAGLCAASHPNRRLIARQIDLSTEMMGVVAAEAQRQSGARSATYGSQGAMTRIDMPAPISINTSV